MNPPASFVPGLASPLFVGNRLRLGPALLAVGIAFFALASSAHGAAGVDAGKSSDVFDLSTTLSTTTRFLVYGFVFVGICLVSLVVPDAPLLVFLCSMSILQLPGLRLALTALECLIVLLRSGALGNLLPSWPLAFFLCCVTASGTWALYPAQSFSLDQGGIGGMVLQLPLLVATCAALRSGLTTLNRLLTAVVLGAVPGALLTIHNALAGIRYLEDPRAPEQSQYYMGFIAPDIFSTILLLAALFLLFWLTSTPARLGHKIVGGLVLSLLCVALLLGGIRSGWLAFAVATLALLIRRRNLYAAGGLVLVLVALLGLSSAVGLHEKMASRMSEQSLGSGQARLHFWELALEGFAKRPVLGIGWGGFPEYAADSTVGNQWATHNIFVRVLCELGVVGFALFSTWIGATAWRVRREPLGSLVLVLMLGILVQGLFLDFFVGSQFWFFLGVCEGVRSSPPVWADGGWGRPVAASRQSAAVPSAQTLPSQA